MTEWMPIETAPRGGEMVLVWLGAIRSKPRMMLASANNLPRSEPLDWPAGWDFPTGTTHWTPLPAPPDL